LVKGEIAEGMTFDGSNDIINLTTDTDLYGTGNFTVSGWFNSNELPESAPNYNGVIYSTRDMDESKGFSIWLANSLGVHRIVFQNRDSEGGAVNSNNNVWEAGTWYHFAVTHTGTTQKIYVNTVEVGSGSNTWNFQQGDDAPVIGIERTGPDIQQKPFRERNRSPV